MPRLIHLARSSAARGITRAGIRGVVARFKVEGGASPADPDTGVRLYTPLMTLESAVFAMPITPNFAVSYQWLRELRRAHDERMVAVHIVLPSSEEVFVGRYHEPHARLPLREALRRVLDEPSGCEVIVPRAVRRGEVVGIRNMTQLVGWTGAPCAKELVDCVCRGCIQTGSRDLMRRVGAAFSHQVAAARRGPSNVEVVAALERLDIPLRRARGRLSPAPLLAFAKSTDELQREVVASLLGYFRWKDAEAPLDALLLDPCEAVRRRAMASIVRAGGLARALAQARSEGAALDLMEELSNVQNAGRAVEVLVALAARGGAARARATELARKMLREDEFGEQTRAKLDALAQ